MREGESGTEAAGINADLQQFATWHGYGKRGVGFLPDGSISIMCAMSQPGCQLTISHRHLKILALLGATANFMPEVLLPHNFNIEVDHIGCGASYQYPNSKY